jgi:preprotein translocase subunit SecE
VQPENSVAVSVRQSVKDSKLARFYNETRSELRKVLWPSRKEWVNLTFMVIVVSVAIGAGLGLVDWVFEKLVLLLVP